MVPLLFGAESGCAFALPWGWSLAFASAAAASCAIEFWVMYSEPSGSRTRTVGRRTVEARGNVSGMAWRTRKATGETERKDVLLAGMHFTLDWGIGGDGGVSLTWNDHGFEENHGQKRQARVVHPVADDQLGTRVHEPKDRDERDGAPAPQADGVEDEHCHAEFREDAVREARKWAEDVDGADGGDGHAESEGDDACCDQICHDSEKQLVVVELQAGREGEGLQVETDCGEDEGQSRADHAGDFELFEGRAVRCGSVVFG